MWIKVQKHSSEEIFSDVINRLGKWRGTPRGNGSAYEYFSDLLKDNYDITLKQCDEICSALKKYYGIKKFYATDK